jgi:hypothetical protein
MLEFCLLNDNELNNLLTSTMDPKKQEAIKEELKRRQKLIGQTGKKRPDIRKKNSLMITKCVRYMRNICYTSNL